MSRGAARATAFVRGASDCFAGSSAAALRHRAGRPAGAPPSARSGRTRDGRGDDSGLLAALLDGMDAALCAFDARRRGHPLEPRGRAASSAGPPPRPSAGAGFAGWAVRTADADEVRARLLAARCDAPGRQVHEFALLTKDGRRVLVRTQSAGRARPGRQARRGLLRLQRGPRADRPGAVHRAERGAVRGRVLGRGPGRRRPAARRRQRARRPHARRRAARRCSAARWASCSRRAWRSWRARCSTCWPRARRPAPPSCG